MRIAILDTNFILTCLRNKIDFFEELYLVGIKIIIPSEVIDEIKRIAESKKKLRFRDEAKLAINLLDKNKFEKIDLGKGYVDKKIILYADKNPKAIVATLDKEIKDKVSNNKLVIRNKKKLEII